MQTVFASKTSGFFVFLVLVLAGALCGAGEVLDPDRYIDLDEITPGMDAYCLTVYKGTEVEKFDLEVLDVVRGVWPGRDAILVQGTDERFVHTGPVGGCSGTPVYIDGRLAGALAFGFTFSKDPLYGVTPIKEMLRVGQVQSQSQRRRLALDFSRPVDFAQIEKRLLDFRYWGISGLGRPAAAAGFEPLPTPLVTFGLPAEAVEQLGSLINPLGLMAVAGPGGGSSIGPGRLASGPPGRQEPTLVPGACLAVPLVTGDITIDTIGTVTEVVDDKVYAFGHSFLGYGSVDLPMATGKVHTVVSNVFRSFKFASAEQIVGALTVDESTAIRGDIGREPRMIPLTIAVSRYNDAQKRIYNCRLVDNQLLTPLVLRYTLYGAALMLGGLPPDHMIRYKVKIDTAAGESIAFENISTGSGIAELLTEGTGSVVLLLNNPYKSVELASIDVDISILPDNVISHIWSADLSDAKVKAGGEVELDVVIESWLAEKKKYHARLTVPRELRPGKYDLLVCGGGGYLQFLRRTAPYRFVPENFPGLIEAMNNILHIKRDNLYCILVLPPGGVVMEKAELPDLPATKALVLQDPKRMLDTVPCQRWVEKAFRTGSVIIDQRKMQITVEK
jgi:hypothetical protein